jgi:serine/threonine-protein kinase
MTSSFNGAMVDSEALVGKVLVGRYRIETLRSDPNAAIKVYEADDLRHNKKVSVRLMTTASLIDRDAGLHDESSAVSSFKESMQQLFAMNHPTLVCIDDWGDTVLEGVRHAFNVTQFYGQGTLREFLDRGRRLSPSQALVVGIDVCRALHHAHQNGFVHGDVRPANLIFGDDARVRLTGLGTKRWASAEQMSIEQAKYAAPEIGLGSAPNAQTDIYSLALTLLESITGEVPFVGESVAITLSNRVEKLLPVSADMGPIAAPIERAGRPLAEERGTAIELGQALAQIADKMSRPLPIDTIVPKKFEDVITRPHPIVNVAEKTESEIVEPVVVDEPVPQIVVESPRTRRRLRRVFAGAGVGALLIVGIVAFQALTKKSFVVPSLTGVAEAEARNSIATFDWEIIIRAERTNDVEFGFVIRTDPEAGASLKQGDAIVMYVSEGAPLGVLFDVTGESREAATKKLTDQGLTVSASDEASDAVPVGNVISWSVAKQPTLVAGDEVLQGTLINLVVSSGPALRSVPLLVGMKLEDATATALELGLVLGVTPDSFSPDVAIGLIGAQSPPPGQFVPKGSTIVYSISLGPDLVELPNIVGINFVDAEKRLVAAGFIVGEVSGRKSYRMKSASVKGVAVKNGDMVPRGSAIDMVFP